MIAQKFLVYISLILALIGTGVGIGYSIATKRYEPLIITCNNALDDINQKTKDTKKEQEATNAKLEKDFNNRESRIHAYYDRMLHSKDNNQASPAPARPISTYETPPPVDEGIARQELERDCTLVSNQVIEFQTWITEQHFPISR